MPKPDDIVNEKPMGASQEKPCWLCKGVNAIQGKCLYHKMEPLLGHARSMAVDLESLSQNRQEWEERALRAEVKLASKEQTYTLSQLQEVYREGHQALADTLLDFSGPGITIPLERALASMKDWEPK